MHVRRNSPDPRDANHLEADSALTGEILLFQLITSQLPAVSSTARCHQPGCREKGGLAASCRGLDKLSAHEPCAYGTSWAAGTAAPPRAAPFSWV